MNYHCRAICYGGRSFKFKKIMPGEAAKNVTAGYSVMLQNQTDNAFTLEQSVPFEGNYLKVYYNFVKISK